MESPIDFNKEKIFYSIGQPVAKEEQTGESMGRSIKQIGEKESPSTEKIHAQSPAHQAPIEQRKTKPQPVDLPDLVFKKYPPIPKSEGIKLYGQMYFREKHDPETLLKINMEIHGLDEETREFVLGFPKEEIGDKWKNYVVQAPKWNRFYNKSDQTIYGQWMNHSAYVASKGLTEKNWNFDEILTFLAACRSTMAYISFYDPLFGYQDAPNFGKNRTGNSSTDLKKEYYLIGDYYNNLVPDGKNVIDATEELVHVPSIKKIYIIQGQTKEGEKPIPLSQIWVANKPMGSFEDVMLARVTHTLPGDFEKAMDHVKNDLFEAALKIDDPDKLMEQLGRIFWWICQAKPWDRGDPSIAEMLIRSILSAKGMENRSWNPNTIPWVEVMMEPDVNKFAANFHKLFTKD